MTYVKPPQFLHLALPYESS